MMDNNIVEEFVRYYGGGNALHAAAYQGTVAEVKTILASADGQEWAMQKTGAGVSEDTVHNPSHSFFFFLFLCFEWLKR